jgi:hypothetical protein
MEQCCCLKLACFRRLHMLEITTPFHVVVVHLTNIFVTTSCLTCLAQA